MKTKDEALEKAALGELWDNAVFDEQVFQLLDTTSHTLQPGQSPLSKEVTSLLTTIRNKNLITTKQQEILQTTVVAFFGMSVGSHAALTWMMQSRANFIKIADPEKIMPTNLNRLRLGWNDITRYKTDAVKDAILAMHPFTHVETLIETSPD